MFVKRIEPSITGVSRPRRAISIIMIIIMINIIIIIIISIIIIITIIIIIIIVVVVVVVLVVVVIVVIVVVVVVIIVIVTSGLLGGVGRPLYGAWGQRERGQRVVDGHRQAIGGRPADQRVDHALERQVTAIVTDQLLTVHPLQPSDHAGSSASASSLTSSSASSSSS